MQPPFVRDEVLDLDIKIESLEDLVNAFKAVGGFQARHLADAIDVLLEMYSDPEATIFISFTGNLVSTGIRGLLARFIERGFADVIITTAGALDHDIAKAMGGAYHVSWFDVDDVEMEKAGFHRIGNIAVKREHYGPLIEKFVHKALSEISRRRTHVGIRELLWEMASYIEDDYSIIRACGIVRTPIYVPGFVDGAFGTAILTFNEMARSRNDIRPITIDVMKDERELMEIIYSSERLGALIIGGGISKHHVIWWSQFKGGLDYVVYITTAIEWDGSLSGARPKEAITWGKVKPNARQTFVFCDATIALPIALPYIIRSLGGWRKKREFSFPHE